MSKIFSQWTRWNLVCFFGMQASASSSWSGRFCRRKSRKEFAGKTDCIYFNRRGVNASPYERLGTTVPLPGSSFNESKWLYRPEVKRSVVAHFPCSLSSPTLNLLIMSSSFPPLTVHPSLYHYLRSLLAISSMCLFSTDSDWTYSEALARTWPFVRPVYDSWIFLFPQRRKKEREEKKKKESFLLSLSLHADRETLIMVLECKTKESGCV